MNILSVLPDCRFDGKVIMITGAGQGIAAAAAKALGSRGARIGVCDRHPDWAAATVEGLKADGHDAIALTVDVGIEVDVMKA